MLDDEDLVNWLNTTSNDPSEQQWDLGNHGPNSQYMPGVAGYNVPPCAPVTAEAPNTGLA